MNEEQRAVLAAIARMEESPGTLIDEYTVARAAGILTTDLAGNEYVQSAGRGQIHRAFDELEALGLIRLDREGFWRPRTTLSGRRALQRPLVVLPPPRPALVPGAAPAAIGATGAAAGASAADDLPDDDGAARRGARAGRGWPAWWPAALRFGDPSLTPILVPTGALLALLLIFLVGRAVVGGQSATPTPTEAAQAAITVTPPIVAPPPTTAGGGVPSPTPRRTVTVTRAVPTPSAPPRDPTPTAGPAAKRVMVVNTDNIGANLYITPAGEKRTAVPEGTIIEVIGPDERDTKGKNWKHIRWGTFEGWIPEEFTMPAD